MTAIWCSLYGIQTPRGTRKAETSSITFDVSCLCGNWKSVARFFDA